MTANGKNVEVFIKKTLSGMDIKAACWWFRRGEWRLLGLVPVVG